MARASGAGLPETAQARFEVLRTRFAGGLPARLTEIETAPDPAMRAAALHRLAGAAGGYGFADIDQAARRALALAEQQVGDSAWAEALAALRHCVAAAAAT